MSMDTLRTLTEIESDIGEPYIERRLFRARRAGRCSRCRRPIRRGDVIISTGRGYAHFRHPVGKLA